MNEPKEKEYWCGKCQAYIPESNAPDRKCPVCKEKVICITPGKVIPINGKIREQHLRQSQFDGILAQIMADRAMSNYHKEQVEWTLRCAVRETENLVGTVETLRIIVEELIMLRSSNS